MSLNIFPIKFLQNISNIYNAPPIFKSFKNENFPVTLEAVSSRQTIHFNVILPGIAVLRARPYLKFRFSPGKANLEYEARSRKGGGRSSFQERRMLRSGAMQQRQVKRIALNVVGGRNAGNAGRHICQLSPPPAPVSHPFTLQSGFADRLRELIVYDRAKLL